MSKARIVTPRPFIQMQGHWQFKAGTATYLGPDERAQQPVGVCLYPTRFRGGSAEVAAKLAEPGAARILIGYNPATGSYYSVGLGGYEFAYVVDRFVPEEGWRAVVGRGAASQLTMGHSYRIQVDVAGQFVSLSVDGVRVIETALPAPLQGNQAGLFAWGKGPVEFDQLTLSGSNPKLFVVMQFGEPFDTLYKDVIRPVAVTLNYETLRADDVFRPGVILQDIRRGIVESDVIVAEITPENANVFYELGYAHALDKPTILLADRATKQLPFDVSGYRVIFYDDTIGGKREVEDTLRKYLEGILAHSSAALPAAGREPPG